MVLPLLLYFTGVFSPYALLANLLALPAIPVVMLLGFFTGLVGFVSTLFSWVFALPATFGLSYILVVAESVTALPFAAIEIPPLPFFTVFLSYSLIGLLLYYFQQRR